jgi:hypothetical protein
MRNLAPERRRLRWVSVLTYCALAALGEAAALKPALLFLRSLGGAPWQVPFGAVFAVLSAAVAVLAFVVVAAQRPRLVMNAALLGAAAIAVALRSVAPSPHRSPAREARSEPADAGLPVYPHLLAKPRAF